MAVLDEKEQNHVRTAIRNLRLRLQTWGVVADALHCGRVTVEAAVNGRIAVSAKMALRVARLLDVSIDDLLAGYVLPGACPHCGHVPDFADEPTRIDDAPPVQPVPSGGRGGLKVVR